MSRRFRNLLIIQKKIFKEKKIEQKKMMLKILLSMCIYSNKFDETYIYLN